MSTPTPQYTDFSKDVLGRYGLDEAIASTSGPGVPARPIAAESARERAGKGRMTCRTLVGLAKLELAIP